MGMTDKMGTIHRAPCILIVTYYLSRKMLIWYWMSL